MNILISNDDGVNAEGLKVLAKALGRENNVYVMAPSANRSAVSNCFTLFNGPLKVCKISDNVYSCSGTPIDCAISGLHSDLFGVKIDVVVSGINRGGNLGRDIVYSGTCAAARQAVFYNIPGIAVSVEAYDWNRAEKEGLKYEAIADFTAKNLKSLMKLCSFGNKAAFVNINGASLDSYKGWKYTTDLAVREYGDRVDIVEDTEDFKTVFHSDNTHSVYDGKNDYSVCKDGYISVSRVYADVIGAPVMDDVKLSM